MITERCCFLANGTVVVVDEIDDKFYRHDDGGDDLTRCVGPVKSSGSSGQPLEDCFCESLRHHVHGNQRYSGAR